jgi:hypothetical protein
MGYRGDDLDLRIPQANPGEVALTAHDPFSAPARPRPTVQSNRGAPIWVDEAVLECCNHAFDVAAAHRAGEVRLDHLIYALTRIDEAAEILEARGVRVAALRREAANAIATDFPSGTGNGKTTPRRGDAFEEVLRIAASRAYRRQAPAGVGDIVYALFDSGVDFPGLFRLLPSNGPRPGAQQDASLSAEAVRERIRSAAAASDPVLRAPDLTGLSAVQTSTQQSRLDAIEQSMRTLTIELANERKLISGVLQDLQRELMAQREDTQRLGSITPEKIQAVFGDRLQSLEQAFVTSRNTNGGDPGAILERIGLLERAIQSEISVTRAAVEEFSAHDVDLTPLLQRVEVIEVAIANERERATAGEKALADAIETVRTTVETQPDEIAALLSPPLTERFEADAAAREAHHTAATESFDDAHRRLVAIEEALEVHAARAESAETRASENHAGITALLERLADAVAQNAANAQEAMAKLTENLTQDLSELHDGLTKVNANQHTLATTLDTQGQDAAVAVAGILGRIQSLETAAAKPLEMLTVLSGTVDKMHKVTVERYYRRNRFWYWLFGTDDWLAASWPSQSARIAEELRNIKH